MPALRERMVRCKAGEGGLKLRARSSVGYLCCVLTVFPWFVVRKSRKSLTQLVGAALTDRLTLLAVVSDHYTNERHIRPFSPLAERFGDRMHVILAAEFEQADRELQGEALLRELQIAPDARRRMLRDEGPVRVAVILRQKRPVAMIELFFAERAYTTLDGRPEPRAAEMQEREDEVFESIAGLLGRLPPPAPPPSRLLQPGEHDFAASGLCLRCNGGRATLSACPGTKRDEGPRRDRFELIELD
jgi:hypothetical protein